MGKQLEMYPPPPPTPDDELNAAQAEMRREQMARERSREDVRREHDRRRSRRRREVRASTISVKRMTKRELELGKLLYPPEEHADVAKPKTRGECKDGPRPCPFVSCKHHLYLDVSARTGAIKVNFPDVDVDGLPESCALDGADRQGMTLEEVGAAMNLTRERIRQVEVKALAKLQAAIEMGKLRDFVDEGPVGRRRLPVLAADDDEDDDDEECTEPDERAESEPGFDAERFASDELDAE